MEVGVGSQCIPAPVRQDETIKPIGPHAIEEHPWGTWGGGGCMAARMQSDSGSGLSRTRESVACVATACRGPDRRDGWHGQQAPPCLFRGAADASDGFLADLVRRQPRGSPKSAAAVPLLARCEVIQGGGRFRGSTAATSGSVPAAASGGRERPAWSGRPDSRSPASGSCGSDGPVRGRRCSR